MHKKQKDSSLYDVFLNDPIILTAIVLIFKWFKPNVCRHFIREEITKLIAAAVKWSRMFIIELINALPWNFDKTVQQ